MKFLSTGRKNSSENSCIMRNSHCKYYVSVRLTKQDYIMHVSLTSGMPIFLTSCSQLLCLTTRPCCIKAAVNCHHLPLIQMDILGHRAWVRGYHHPVYSEIWAASVICGIGYHFVREIVTNIHSAYQKIVVMAVPLGRCCIWSKIKLSDIVLYLKVSFNPNGDR